MKSLLLTVVTVAFLMGLNSCATGLGSFGAEMGAKSNPVGFIPGQSSQVRVPYLSTTKYFGYINPGQEPDAVVEGKNMYFLYVWVPAVAPEIGVRMLSPVADLAKPEEGDIVASNYEAGIADDPEAYFDTWISLERAATIVNPEDISANFNSTSWIKYDNNDDSSEMPKQPSGSSYNSLMRIEATDKPLLRGLYRVGFTTYKVGEVKGSFYAEIGAPVELPGVVVAKSIEKVIELTKEQ